MKKRIDPAKVLTPYELKVYRNALGMGVQPGPALAFVLRRRQEQKKGRKDA
jgi:hypothetical protein